MVLGIRLYAGSPADRGSIIGSVLCPPVRRLALCCALVALSRGLPAAPATERHAAQPAISVWEQALRDPSPLVRANAARRLADLGERSACTALLNVLKDPDAGVRRAAAQALGRLHCDRAVSALVQALADKDATVRYMAAWALGELRAASAVESLMRLLDDPEWTVRNQAAAALRAIHERSCLPILLDRLMRAESVSQRRLLVWILKGFPAEQAAPAIAAALKRARDPGVKVMLMRLLWFTDAKAAVGTIEAFLDDPDPVVRREAVSILAGTGRARWRAKFETLAKQDPDARVREAARESLKRLVVASGVEAWWSFDEKKQQAGIVRDVTGQGNDGKLVGDCRFAPGVRGNALVCRKGGYVEFGRPPGVHIGNRPYSVTAWVYPEKDRGVVIARGGAWCGFSLYVLDGKPRFGIHLLKDGPAYIAAAGAAIPLRKWTFLAGVVHKDHIELYVNGRLAAAAKTKGFIPSDCGQGLEIGFDTGNSPAEITDAFTGMIDEVKFWGRALSEQDVMKEMQASRSDKP